MDRLLIKNHIQIMIHYPSSIFYIAHVEISLAHRKNFTIKHRLNILHKFTISIVKK